MRMPAVRRSVIATIAISFLLAASNTTPAAQRPQKIKVYFYHEPGEYIDLSPVTRTIRTASPARAAIQALLKGPTAAERKQGFDGLASASDFAIGSLTVRNEPRGSILSSVRTGAVFRETSRRRDLRKQSS